MRKYSQVFSIFSLKKFGGFGDFEGTKLFRKSQFSITTLDSYDDTTERLLKDKK